MAQISSYYVISFVWSIRKGQIFFYSVECRAWLPRTGGIDRIDWEQAQGAFGAAYCTGGKGCINLC